LILVEFGLDRESDEIRAYGASILSFSAEILRIFESGKVSMLKPDLDWVLEDSDEDYSDFQNRVVLFESWDHFYAFTYSSIDLIFSAKTN